MRIFKKKIKWPLERQEKITVQNSSTFSIEHLKLSFMTILMFGANSFNIAETMSDVEHPMKRKTCEKKTTEIKHANSISSIDRLLSMANELTFY